MPDLSACYFCGTALDEPPSEYPVVPTTLQPAPDQQRTVVLCSTCRRKLGRVVDAVLEAVDDRSTGGTVQRGLSTAGTGVSADDDGANAWQADAPGSDPGANEGGTGEPDAPSGTRATGTTETDASGSGDTDESGTAGTATEDETADVGESRTAGTATEDERESAAGATVADADASETGGDGGLDASEGTASTDAGADPADAAEASDAGRAVVEGGDRGVSALEYSKVMRLLENREFPIDREEIRVVATNAYEIRPREFDAIVDAAIDRGLIVEEDGEFVEEE